MDGGDGGVALLEALLEGLVERVGTGELLGQGLELVVYGVDGGLGLREAVLELAHLAVCGVEGLVDGARHRVDARGARGDGVVDGVRGAVEGVAEPADAVSGVAQRAAHVGRALERGGCETRAAAEQILRGGDDRRVGAHVLRDVAHLRDRARERLVELARRLHDLRVGEGGVELVEQRRAHLHHR